MGCISSKLAKSDLKREKVLGGAVDFPNHIVSLTSTTYGVLNLDRDQQPANQDGANAAFSTTSLSPISHKRDLDEPEVINAWELMHDLHDEVSYALSPVKSPLSDVRGHSILEADVKSGSKFFYQKKVPKQKKRSVGKENKQNKDTEFEEGWGRAVLKPFSSIENLQASSPPPLKVRLKTTPASAKSLDVTNQSRLSASTRSLSPLFDPELLASFERKLSDEKEQIKKMVSPKPKSRKAKDLDLLLESLEKKCPPGGENAVVVYTTTLRGIRKTFEDCNRVRSVIEAYDVRMIERDISMDSGFREELRVLMGVKGVRVPVVFVKGRLIGGVDEVIKLEESGKLSVLLEGIPAAPEWCMGCGGLRFVMCMDCSGSCKVLDKEGKKTARCGECNENGLIQCPICC